jgi:hypothetical protein
VHPDVDRRRQRLQLGERPGEIAVQRQRDLRERGDGVAGGGRVGGVGFDEEHRPLAAHQLAAEVLGDGDRELHFAPRKQAVELGWRLRLSLHAEVAACLHRREQGARVDAGIGREHRGRQALGIGIDGVAEEDELQHGNADDHAEGEAVALELDELFHDDAEPALPRETVRSHWKLSGAPAMR